MEDGVKLLLELNIISCNKKFVGALLPNSEAKRVCTKCISNIIVLFNQPSRYIYLDQFAC